MNVLIVEDEKRMAELLRKGLEEEGHKIVCAADGMEGLELSKSYDFDMIILDVMMPRLDGYELAKKLRADKIPTPILMLTAKDSVQDIVRGLDLGADDYLTKPFSFNELLARVRAVKRRALVPAANHLHSGRSFARPCNQGGVAGRYKAGAHPHRVQSVGTAHGTGRQGRAAPPSYRIRMGL